MTAPIIIPAEIANPKSGKIEGNHANVMRILESVGDAIRYDSFSGRTVVSGLGGDLEDGEWTDFHTNELTMLLQARGCKVRPRVVAEVVTAHAQGREFNALSDWVTMVAAKWDGTPRVNESMARYWRASDTRASRAAGRVFLLSLAARALKPGCKMDTAPLLRGTQGSFKSASLVGQSWFADSPLLVGGKVRITRGIWLWETTGITKRNMRIVKPYLSSAVDVCRARRIPRQTVLVISTNKQEMFNELRGERRFLPVDVGRVDIDALERDREQLLGEAAQRVLAGEQWWPTSQEDSALRRGDAGQGRSTRRRSENR